MQKLFVVFFLLFSLSVFSQDVNIASGWKFKAGDSSNWSSPKYNDNDWAPIKVGEVWETQGYPNYDGFGWYRLHVVIPSSIKEKAFLKEKIRFDLGLIDDGDEVYLIGLFIGKNAGKNADIKQGEYDVQRTYLVSINNPGILWDKENVIAVRVFDHGGDGGMYAGKYGISVMDIVDYIKINTSNDFNFKDTKQLSKKISLESMSDKYDFSGRLRIVVEDPVTHATVFQQLISADFAKSKPFEYTFKTNLPENKSYIVSYSFQESRT